MAGVLAIGLLFGCGGSGGSSSSSAAGAEAESTSTGTGTEPEGNSTDAEAESTSAGAEAEGTSTHKAFVSEADAICEADGKKMTNAFIRSVNGASGSRVAAEAVAIKSVVVPWFGTEQERLSGLSVPDEDRAKMRKLLASYGETIDAVKAQPAKYVNNPYGKIEGPAKELGLTVCPL